MNLESASRHSGAELFETRERRVEVPNAICGTEAPNAAAAGYEFLYRLFSKVLGTASTV